MGTQERQELTGARALVIVQDQGLAQAIKAQLSSQGASVELAPFPTAESDESSPYSGAVVDVLVVGPPSAQGCRQLFEVFGGVVQSMGERGSGRVVLLSSASASKDSKVGLEARWLRQAVIGLVRHWAEEFSKQGVTVNGIDLVQTSSADDESRRVLHETIPLGREITPREVASAVSFLASPRGGYITGVQLPVNGGAGLALFPGQYRDSGPLQV